MQQQNELKPKKTKTQSNYTHYHHHQRPVGRTQISQQEKNRLPLFEHEEPIFFRMGIFNMDWHSIGNAL